MSYSSEVLADSPAVYYRCQEASGLLQDSSGNNRHTTVKQGAGTVTYQVTSPITSDPSDRAITLDGAANFTTPDVGLDMGDVVTVECWAKPASASATERDLISKGTGAYAIGLSGVSANDFFGAKSLTAVLVWTAGSLIGTDWVHLVYVKNTTTNLVYVNGINSTLSSGNQALVNNAVALSIGSDEGSVASFPGSMDEIAVYSTPLSAARVLAHYNAAFLVPAPALGYQRIVGPTAFATSAADLYTVPDDARARIRKVYVNNPTGGEIEFTLSVGNDAAGTRLLDQHAVAAGESYSGRRATDHTLVGGEKIQGFADSASAIVVIDAFLESV